MQKIKIFIYVVSALIIFFLIQGCSQLIPTMETTRAKLGPLTPVNKELKALPAAKDKIVAAVYKFRDQTGQYKATANGTSWSTAVTQGATSILLKALEESGWFIPIEREGLSNLLNERKIIRSSRAEYLDKNNQQDQLLPPLLFAGVILEGGIISYDTNILTGGAGIKYFGISSSGQYRQDRVTIYLRAISTQNGRILKTVYTTKTVLSQLIDVGFFRYVSFKRLLEAETGYSYNEPPEMCVTEAIEKAVESLVIEGLKDGLWELKNPTDINASVIKEYEKEKIVDQKTDDYGRNLTAVRTKWGASLNLGTQTYSGDYANALTRAAGELQLQYAWGNGLSLSLNVGRWQLYTENYLHKTFNNAEIQAKYYLNPLNEFTPYIFAGAGFSIEDQSFLKLSDNLFPFLIGGVGAEYMISNRVGLNFLISNHYMLNDKIDGTKHGDLNDYFWGTRVGFCFYLGK